MWDGQDSVSAAGRWATLGEEELSRAASTVVVPKVMPSYFRGNYSRYKEHNNSI